MFFNNKEALSLSELTPYKIYSELTHLGSEAYMIRLFPELRKQRSVDLFSFTEALKSLTNKT